MKPFRRTWAEINKTALSNNYNAVRRLTGREVWPVVKANGYGHEAVEVSRLFQQQGACGFVVSNLLEGEELRQAGITGEILILGYTPPEEVNALAAGDFSQCIYSLDFARALSDRAEAEGLLIKAHLKLDTGMARIGFDCRGGKTGLQEAARALKLPALQFTGVFTHFATADGTGIEDAAFTLLQAERFAYGVTFLEREGATFSYKHCSNSAAVFTLPHGESDIVRAGIILYGLAPSEEVPLPPDFTAAMEFYSVVSMVKDLRAGESVSYGCTYRSDSPRRIATVSAGYADGYPRLCSNQGYVLIHGKKAPILGRVCMDQFCVDVTDIPDVKMGDQATLFGPGLPVEEVARWAKTINYEIVCSIGKRVPRIFTEK